MNRSQSEFLAIRDTTDWEKKHSKFIWTRYVLIFLGFWLLVNLPTFGMSSERMTWSDIISGLGLIIFGSLSLSSKNIWAPWITCLIGIWLQFAPLFFWAPTAFAYLNDTVIGILVIALSILIPGTPGMTEDKGPATPAGWTYNPSSWVQRLPIIVLTCICWFASRYMAAFQLGYIHTMWDPVFENGTLDVITSSVSKAFPISDAGLGAIVYSLEALMGAKGGIRRWRTMPWMVALFGLMVIPAGLVSIILIMLQPLLIGAWCFWCLLTAVCMLTMIALTVDEVVATAQYLREITQRGHAFWQVFWKGGPALSTQIEDLHVSNDKSSWQTFTTAFRGVSIPWNLVLSLILGLWLLFHTGPRITAVNIGHILGALTITFSIIAMAEVMRTARFANTVLGAFCFILPFLMHAPADVMWKSIFIGILLVGLSLPKGKITENYGAWQQSIR